MFDFVSVFIGIFFGFLLLTVVVWVSYSNRVFVFSGCIAHDVRCRYNNYFNNPGKAIAEGYKADQIMYVNNQGRLIYKRVPKDICMPGNNQEIPIIRPQYCTFTDENRNTHIGKNNKFGSPYYTLKDKNIGVFATKDCQPENTDCNSRYQMTNGYPLVSWDNY